MSLQVVAATAVAVGKACWCTTTLLNLCVPAQTKKGADPKKAKFQVGVYDSKLGAAIQEAQGYACVCNEMTGELLRGVRLHISSFIKQLEELDVRRSQLGLAHSYSRAKVLLCLVWCLLRCLLVRLAQTWLNCIYCPFQRYNQVSSACRLQLAFTELRHHSCTVTE